MTDDYIRKDDAVEETLKYIISSGVSNQSTWNECVRTIADTLQDMRPADVVFVVRCRDCKHCYFADNRVPDEQGWVCEINSSEPVNLNGFCSYGERKE